MAEKKSSKAWFFFVEDEDQQHLACCKKCDKKVPRGLPNKRKEWSTSNLLSHLRTAHPKELADYDRQAAEQARQEAATPAASTSAATENSGRSSRQQTLAECISRSAKWSSDSPEAKQLTNAIGRMLALDLQPFQMVENIGFRHVMSLAAPRYVIPSRRYFAETVLDELFREMQDKIRASLQDAKDVSFTVDLWTAPFTTQSFMSLTAHWITSQFERMCAVLHCEAYNVAHTAEQLGTAFNSMLGNWGLLERCHCVVHDNGRNIVKAFEDLNTTHVSCLAHTLQLVVHDGLLHQGYVSVVLSICRKIVGHLKHSSSATSAFAAAQRSLHQSVLQIVQDVPTRWNSTLYMVERLLERREAISIVCAGTTKIDALTADQWDLLNDIASLLKPFEEMTRDLSKKEACISLVIPAVKALMAFLTAESPNDARVKSMKMGLRNSLEKRLGGVAAVPAFSLSTLLDPRFQTRCFDDAQTCATKALLLQAQAEVLTMMTNAQPTSTNSAAPPSAKRPRTSDAWQFVDDLLMSNDEAGGAPGAGHGSLDAELATYLVEPRIPRSENPLEWWKVNAHRFPQLARLSRSFLSAPPTSVPSECIFSIAGDVLSEHRSRLLPERAEMLILMKANMVFLEGYQPSPCSE